MLRLTILSASLFLIGSAFALDPNRVMSQYLRDQWTTEQGFPRGPVYAISQTLDGYLWIGTGAGLVRFDGISFHEVKGTSGTLATAGVTELTGDRDGCLWVRFENLNLLRYCDGAFKSPSAVSGEATSASAISRTNHGEILIAAPQKGALVFHQGKFRTLAGAGDLSRTPATAVIQMPNGDVWVGTREAGVFRFARGGASPILNGLRDAKINCLLANGDGDLWIGTDDGVVRWNGKDFVAAEGATPVRRFQALSMAKDRDGNVWVGTDSRGLLRFNSQGIIGTSEGHGAHEAITALFEDREGNLWIGTASGLARLRDSVFVTYSLPEGLPTDGSNPVFVDSENRIWFSSVAGGLWWTRDGQHGHVVASGLDKDVVYSIAGQRGELWLGRQHGGLTRLYSANGSFTTKSYTQADGLAQNSVFSVYETTEGSVWAGTLSGGASRFSRGKFTTYTVADGLASNTVLSILESRDGAMWFATPSGLTSLSKGRSKTYSQRDGLPSSNVNCLIEDSSGILWVGTTAGLALGDSRGFRIPVEAPATLREPIFGIAEDKFGWLWLSTSSHVLRVRRDKLLSGALADGDAREFGLADGLRGSEGVKRHRSVVTDSQGRIWLSLNRGISSVDPVRLVRDSAPAIIHLQSITADNNAIASARSVRIPGGSKRIVFGFIGLSLSAPEKVHFRYRLDGFDHGWSQPSGTPEASYTNLSPGEYRFRVIASNPEGVWSSDEATVGLQVEALYWQTWWFASLSCWCACPALEQFIRCGCTRLRGS